MGGTLHLRFQDPARQADFMKMMTPEARRALQMVLQGGSGVPMGLLEMGAKKVSKKVSQTPSQTVTVSNETIDSALSAQAEADPVSDLPSDDFGWKKCGDVPYNCPRLHDMLSVEWGKFRDK